MSRAVVAIVLMWSLIAPAWAAELRDPFMFGSRTGEGQGTGPVLNGIVWDPTRPVALVGDEAVAVGDHIAGWQVVVIQQDGIMIQRGEQREFIPPGSPLPTE